MKRKKPFLAVILDRLDSWAAEINQLLAHPSEIGSFRLEVMISEFLPLIDAGLDSGLLSTEQWRNIRTKALCIRGMLLQVREIQDRTSRSRLRRGDLRPGGWVRIDDDRTCRPSHDMEGGSRSATVPLEHTG